MVYTKNTWVDDDPTKPLSAGRMNHLETQFDEALTVIATSNATINVKDQGAVGDGITDDTSAFERALQTCPDGGTVLVPKGTYLITRTLKNQNIDGSVKSIRFTGRGARLLKANTDGGRLITFTGAWDATVAVDGLTVGTFTETSWDMQTVIATHSDTMPWKRGDVVKLFSDDSIPGARDAGSRSGQFFTVLSVASGSTTFLGFLRDPLTTNVRMARLQNVQCRVEGFELDVQDAALANNTTGEMLGFQSMIAPSVDSVLIRRSLSQGFSMGSCYGYEVRNCTILWAWNDETTRFGYGVNDNASEGGLVVGCRFAQVRHGVTDSNANYAAGATDPGLYGRTFGMHVDNVTVDSPTSAAFDFHAGGQNNTVSNCVAYGGVVGFAVRGRQHNLVNNRTYGSLTGVRLFNESAGGESWGHTVTATAVDGASVSALEIVNNAGGASPNFGVREARKHTIRGFKATNNTGKGLNAFNTTVDLTDFSVDFMQASSSGLQFNYVQNCLIIGHDWRLDLLGSPTGAGGILFDLTTTVDSDFDVSDIRVVGFSTLSSRVATLIQNTATSTLRINRLVTDYNINTWFNSMTTNSYIDFDTHARPGQSSASLSFAQADVTSTTQILKIANTRKNAITVECTLTAAATLANLPGPMVRGQMLTIVNVSSSAASLTLNHGTTPRTELIGATAKTIAAGQSITLVAMASGVWKQISVVA